MLIEINKLIGKNTDVSSFFTRYLKKKNPNCIENEFYKITCNRVDEKSSIKIEEDDFSLKNKRLVAKKLYSEGAYETAENYYSQIYKETNNIIYKYYIAKCLYKEKKMDDAEISFKEYEANGGEKLNKTYLYLAMIGRRKSNYDQFNNYISKQNAVNKLFDIDYKFDYDRLTKEYVYSKKRK